MAIVCPDCGKELNTVIVEQDSARLYDLHAETKAIAPRANESWNFGEHRYRCPHCDSLNVDELLSDFDLEL